MSRQFSPAQKFRILVMHEAYVIADGVLTPVAHHVYGTQRDELRFRMLRRNLNCAVRCACGCDAVTPLSDIQFDHKDPHCYGGATHVSNGRPLTVACHRIKSRVEHAATARDDRIRRKLSVTTGLRENDSISPETRPSRRSWPQRSFPKSSRPMQSRPFQKRWEPRT